MKRNTEFEELLVASAKEFFCGDLVRRDRRGRIVDTTKYVTASEIHKCARRLRYEKTGVVPRVTPKDDENSIHEGYFIRGNHIESWLSNILQGMFGQRRCKFLGTRQVTFCDDGNGIAGTPDGLLTFDDGNYVLEIKSIDSEVFEPHPSHVDQLKVNMMLVNENVDPVKGGMLIYVNASNWLDIDVFTFSIEEAHDAYEYFADKANKVLNYELDQVPYEGARTKVCSACPFRETCIDSLIESGRSDKEVLLEQVKSLPSGERFQPFSSDEEVDDAKIAFLEFMSSREAADKFSKDAEKHREDAKRYLYHLGGEVEYQGKVAKLSTTKRVTYDSKSMVAVLKEYGEDAAQFANETVVENIRLVKPKKRATNDA